MKHFLVLLCLYFMYPLVAMKNEDIVFAMPFSRDSTNCKESEDSGMYRCHTLEDVKNFVRSHSSPAEITLEYLKKSLDVAPSVFEEKYVQEQSFNDISVQNTAQNVALFIMTEMKKNNNDEYLKHVLTMMHSFISPNEGSMTMRRKNITQPITDEDPVAPLPIARSLDALVVEDLAKRNNTLKEKITAKECCDKVYQISIVLLTVISVIVPTVQAFLGNAVPPVIQSVANCSSIL